MNTSKRHSTGIRGLDALLGGGLVPGTLSVVVGATGIGKTQLGLQFAHAGQAQEGRPGVVFDMTSRGDAQNHAAYAQRMFGWRMETAPTDVEPSGQRVFEPEHRPGQYLHVFDYHGRRVTRSDLGWDAWQDWQAEVARKLGVTIGFFYANFAAGARRAVIDGIEPAERPSESIQFELFEYVYHQILRKESDWVARDLLREHYRSRQADAARLAYPVEQVSCLLLYTSAEVLLDDLLARPLEQGDVLSNANTIVYMGKVRDGQRMGRALHVAKHRGSVASDDIVPYTIGEQGLIVG